MDSSQPFVVQAGPFHEDIPICVHTGNHIFLHANLVGDHIREDLCEHPIPHIIRGVLTVLLAFSPPCVDVLRKIVVVLAFGEMEGVSLATD